MHTIWLLIQFRQFLTKIIVSVESVVSAGGQAFNNLRTTVLGLEEITAFPIELFPQPKWLRRRIVA